jgi:hypothetical protein
MLLLASTSDIVRIVTSATADIEVHASYVDNASGTITPGRTNTASITTATTTTIVGSPGASTQRNVKHLNIFNNHAATACVVTVEHFDGTTAEVLFEVTLAANESLVFDQAGRWTVYDANGFAKGAVFPSATQGDQETGTSTSVYVTPGVQHHHPSSNKFWLHAGLTGNILASYNITSLTDTGTGVITVTIANDFSSANYACVGCIGFNSTTLAQSCTIDSKVAGSFVGRSVVEAGSSADPVDWNFQGAGDL